MVRREAFFLVLLAGTCLDAFMFVNVACQHSCILSKMSARRDHEVLSKLTTCSGVVSPLHSVPDGSLIQQGSDRGGEERTAYAPQLR